MSALVERQAAILAVLQERPGSNVEALQEELALRAEDFSSKEALSAALRRLRSRGLVDAQRWAVDARVYLYSPTQEGLEALAAWRTPSVPSA